MEGISGSCLCLYVPSQNTYGTIYIPKSYEVAKTMLEDILFFIVAFISEIIGAIAGFGSSTIFLPLSLFFVDFKTALILVAISHLFGNLGRINFFRHGLYKRIIITFGIPSILLSFVGASIVGWLPNAKLIDDSGGIDSGGGSICFKK